MFFLNFLFAFCFVSFFLPCFQWFDTAEVRLSIGGRKGIRHVEN